MIKRDLLKTIVENVKPGFINLIYGPRRVGKTVLLEQIGNHFKKEKKLFLNGDTQETRELLEKPQAAGLARTVASYSFIAIDEAQRINNINLSLKILIDEFPDKKFFVTGSSSLRLAKGFQETLTGRTQKYRLFPLSTKELGQNLEDYQKGTLLENQLLFGGYPYLIKLQKPQDKKNYLLSLVEDYLLRDILLIEEVNQPETLKKLATLLAFQIGSEASLNELANNLNIDAKTVNRYLYLLKQGFIIFEIGSFARNLRSELKKSKKYYFWDLGIRNALINQFSPLDVRNDTGQLWENFLAVERFKKLELKRENPTYYFWKNYSGAEIDWLETKDEKIKAFEFKWKKFQAKTPKAFLQAYKTKTKVINRDNYLNFVT